MSRLFWSILYLNRLINLGCTTIHRGYQGDIPCMEVDINYKNKSMITTGMIVEKSIVKLETNENSVFGEISKLMVGGDRIFVLDNRHAKSLFVFDMQGLFLFKINNNSGPETIYAIHDFFIDTLKKRIIVYDGSMRNLHHFSWDGNCVKSMTFHTIRPWACYPINEEIYAFDFIRKDKKKNPFHLLLMNQEGDILFKFKPLYINHNYANKYHVSFYQGINKVYYVPVHCDTIFGLSDQGIENGIYINFGKNALPESLKNAESKEKGKMLMKSNFCYGIKNIMETSKIFYFQYNQGGRRYAIYYDKQTGKTYSNMIYLPDAVATYGEYFVSVWDSYLLELVMEENDLRYINKAKEAIGDENWLHITQMKEYDNPILCFYKLKL